VRVCVWVCVCVCLSYCPHETTRIQLEEFSLNLTLRIFRISVEKIHISSVAYPGILFVGVQQIQLTTAGRGKRNLANQVCWGQL